MGGKADSQAIERYVVIVTGRDSPGSGSFTKAARRGRGELAGAAIVTIARLEEICLERPFRDRRSHRESVRYASAKDKLKDSVPKVILSGGRTTDCTDFTDFWVTGATEKSVKSA
jgi:hypothetical protein